ncbi:hypothetical protein [Anaerosphaera multitolerans]|uniref:Uncharacterized protein n=1 Tax=Anaerosphaera multitolerans TaxID=2487351 RepID=A0A437S905_9FIRM|nr:hypothetical protein [Anaerosphaera multitolerans]RVU55586.1 hypothetical protein EF514_02325 [Anaerosphaera multitolerans]
MLYRLNLLEKESYETLFEREILIVNYKAKSGSSVKIRDDIVIEEDINQFINLILNIGIDDYIWISYREKYSLAKVTDRTYFDKDRFLGLIKVEVFRYYGPLPKKILEGIDKIQIEKIIDGDLLLKSMDIFKALKSLNEKSFDISEEEDSEVLQLEFVKKENALVEIKNSYGIIPYKKKRKIKRKDETNNFGEMVIELHPPEEKIEREVKLPLPTRKATPALKSGIDFYLYLIKNKMDYYSRLKEKESENINSYNMDRYIWGRFFKDKK